jgi:hypothetical protein
LDLQSVIVWSAGLSRHLTRPIRLENCARFEGVDFHARNRFFPKIENATASTLPRMTNTIITIQNATSNGLIERYSSSSDFWANVADISATFVVVGVLAEILELAPKILKAGLHLKWGFVIKRKTQIQFKLDWFDKHEHWMDVWGFLFWMIIVAALAGELLGERIARHFDSLTIEDLNGEASLANKAAAKANGRAGIAEKEAAQANVRAANTESNNLVLRQQIDDLRPDKAPIFAVMAHLDLLFSIDQSVRDGQWKPSRVEGDGVAQLDIGLRLLRDEEAGDNGFTFLSGKFSVGADFMERYCNVSIDLPLLPRMGGDASHLIPSLYGQPAGRISDIDSFRLRISGIKPSSENPMVGIAVSGKLIIAFNSLTKTVDLNSFSLALPVDISFDGLTTTNPVVNVRK